jgi:hypothetical protein
MAVAACAVGRISTDGPWIGFAPVLEDGYALVVGTHDRAVDAPAEADDLIALAIAYFADELPEPPEPLAATHGDIGALVRRLAVGGVDEDHARRLTEAVDAIDDGLAADVVVARLSRCLVSDEEPLQRLRRRASELLGDYPSRGR